LYVGEDTEFLQRLLNGGEKLLYAPWPVIYHRVPAHRMSKQYFRKWKYDEGQMKGQLRHQAKYFHFFNLQTLTPKKLARDFMASTLKIGCFAKDRFRQELRISYILGFISGRVKQMRGKSPSTLKGPTSVDIELTNRCNLRCPMCWFYGQNGIGDRYRDSELKTEQVLDLIDQLAAGKPHLYFGGAEPFLRRDFLAILTHVKRCGLSVAFTTNGTLLNQAAIETLVELGVNDLNVSIDGPEEVHDQRRGRGTFRKVLANLQQLLECRKRERRKSPRVTINITINPFMVGRLKETIDTIREATGDAVDFYRIHHLWFVTPGELQAHQGEVQQALGGMAPGARSHCIPLSQLQAPGVLAQEIAQLKSVDKVISFPDIHGQEIHDYYSDGYRSTKRCLAPFQRVLVKPNGDVKFCPDEWIDDYVLGNVHQQRFDAIWNGDKANHFRSVIFQKRTFPACKRCSWLYSCNP
jgi:radical SAM protein with 4Fe4S-binding SPASM domain